jgi:hypothetical protein
MRSAKQLAHAPAVMMYTLVTGQIMYKIFMYIISGHIYPAIYDTISYIFIYLINVLYSHAANGGLLSIGD